jgi:hypothetical protein
MRVLLDLNIILDVLLNRAPWVTDSAATWDAHRAGEVVAHVAAFAVPTVFYVMRRQSDLIRAHEGVRICLESLEIAPVTRSTLQLARRQAGSDYEDNLQIACAVEAGLQQANFGQGNLVVDDFCGGAEDGQAWIPASRPGFSCRAFPCPQFACRGDERDGCASGRRSADHRP